MLLKAEYYTENTSMSVQIKRLALFVTVFLSLVLMHKATAQCVSVFPYQQDFESSNGNWTTGGTGSSWAWGVVSKPVIQAAASGTKCWSTAGLTGTAYSNGEASWLQSPCFDFTNLQYPYISMKIFWETEQQYDGAAFQYSTDNGITWTTVGSTADKDCITSNWYNQDPVTYLSPFTSTRQGWSGNSKTSSGSCRGGNGSNQWVAASHTLPAVGGMKNVIFRFIFGAGTLCNNYDGFAVDDFKIEETPANDASFTFSCLNENTVEFTNTSSLCPTSFNWNFGDIASGTNNTSLLENPQHIFSAAGEYNVSLTVSGPGNAASTITNIVKIISLTPSVLSNASCTTGTGGSVTVNVNGAQGAFNYLWSTTPAQTTATATNLNAGTYNVTVSGTDVCTADTSITVDIDLSCIGVYFPSAFTPNGDGLNDTFGPLGSVSSLSDYELRIYNRWGELIFYSTDPFKTWDGKTNVQHNDQGLFVWTAEFSLAGKPREKRKGNILIIK